MAVDWIKDPDANLDWTFDWASWLRSGETLSASEWTVSAGITLVSPPPEWPGSVLTVSTTTQWVSGGAPGEPYVLSNKVTTSHGRIDERSITIRVTNR